jgi:hypothetical protein
MKKSEIRELLEKDHIDAVKIMRSPADPSQWIVLLKVNDGKSFFLISDDEQVCAYPSLDDAVDTLDAIGFVRAEVMF